MGKTMTNDLCLMTFVCQLESEDGKTIIHFTLHLNTKNHESSRLNGAVTMFQFLQEESG